MKSIPILYEIILLNAFGNDDFILAFLTMKTEIYDDKKKKNILQTEQGRLRRENEGVNGGPSQSGHSLSTVTVQANFMK